MTHTTYATTPLSNSFASISFPFPLYITTPHILHNPFINPITFLSLSFQFHSPQKLISFHFFPNPIMGLQNQLTDISSDSVPIFLLATIANTVSYLRSLLYTFLGIISRHQSEDAAFLFETVGSGLAGLVLLADQLNLNNVFSYKYTPSFTDNSTECVVCLNTLVNGEQVRKLDCHHVFHKECFDGWLDHLNFNCPLCRSPLVSDQRVEFTRRRLADDVMDWFSFR